MTATAILPKRPDRLPTLRTGLHTDIAQPACVLAWGCRTPGKQFAAADTFVSLKPGYRSGRSQNFSDFQTAKS
jgi:hypothetical protein